MNYKEFWGSRSLDEVVGLFKSAPFVASAWMNPTNSDIVSERMSLTVGWCAGYIYLKEEIDEATNDIIEVVPQTYELVATSLHKRKSDSDWSVEWNNVRGEAPSLEAAQKACDDKLVELGWMFV